MHTWHEVRKFASHKFRLTLDSDHLCLEHILFSDARCMILTFFCNNWNRRIHRRIIAHDIDLWPGTPEHR